MPSTIAPTPTVLLAGAISLLSLLGGSSFAQRIVKTDVGDLPGDRVRVVKSIYLDTLLCERSYGTAPRSEGGMSNEELFMRGLKPSGRTDSLQVYWYAADRTLDSVGLAYDRALSTTYQGSLYDESGFRIEEVNASVSGRAGTEVSAGLDIVNQSPQDLLIRLKNLGGFISAPDSLLVPARQTVPLRMTVALQSGDASHEIIFECPPYSPQKVWVRSVGYDLVEMDFTPDRALAASKPHRASVDRDLLVQVLGNQKLLTILGADGLARVPTSKLLNTIEAGTLAPGDYILKLQNLGSETERYCGIRVW